MKAVNIRTYREKTIDERIKEFERENSTISKALKKVAAAYKSNRKFKIKKIKTIVLHAKKESKI